MANLSYDKKLSEIGAMGYAGIFNSLKTKFILDSLTALSILYSIKLKGLHRKANNISIRSGMSINEQESLIDIEPIEVELKFDSKTLQKLFKEGPLQSMYEGSKA